MLAHPLNFQHNIAELEDDSCKVRKTGLASMLETLVFMKTLCNFLIKNPDPTIVPVYAFQDCGWQSNGNYMYTYDMERLIPLSRYEKKIIRSSADGFFERGLFPSENHSEVIADGKKDYPGLLEFLENVMRLGHYGDINEGNFMMDTMGQYRIIDLEGFYHVPLNHTKNLWFQ